MNRSLVNSSAIRSVGYDRSQQILEVEYQNGAVYQYLEVPEAMYADLLTASSHGRFVEEQVKRAGFGFRKVERAD